MNKSQATSRRGGKKGKGSKSSKNKRISGKGQIVPKSKQMGLSAKEVLELANKKKEIQAAEE